MLITYMFLLIYHREIASIGVMRGKKEEKHCKTLWFYEMEEMLFLQFCCVQHYMWILLN
jgi:hypothetical protein